MFILFKNNTFELAINALSVKEIIRKQDFIHQDNNQNYYGVVNFRGTNVPVSLIENYIPLNGVFLIIQNSQGLGCIWVDEVVTSINKGFSIKNILLDQKNREILDHKNKLYSIIDPQEIYSFNV